MGYRTVIAGSRDITDFNRVERIIDRCPWAISTLMEGGAKGVDKLANRYAKNKGWIPETYPADWNNNGRAAGPIRNEIMAQKAEAVIAIWDGKSRGTSHMINMAIKYKLHLFMVIIDKED